MIKKAVCFILIPALVFLPGRVYPLTSRTSFSEKSFGREAETLMGVLRFAETGEIPDTNLLRAGFGVEVYRNTTGAYIEGGNFRIRLFDPQRDAPRALKTAGELVCEEKIRNGLTAQVYFKGISEKDKIRIIEFVRNTDSLSRLSRMVFEEIISCPAGGEDVVKMQGADWKRVIRYGLYGILILSLPAYLFPAGYWGAGILSISAGITLLYRFESSGYRYKKVRIPRALRKKLKGNKAVNRELRGFIEGLERGNLFTKDGSVFLAGDFSRLLVARRRDIAVQILENELGIEKQAAQRAVDCGLEAMEYKDECTAGDLRLMVMPLFTEKIITGIANGMFLYVTKRGEIKRLGMEECYRYARQGKTALYHVLRNSVRPGRIKRIPSFAAEDAAEFMSLVLADLGPEADSADFVNGVISLDLLPYILRPGRRHRFIRRFVLEGMSSLPDTADAFNAVLDCMGIDEGLAFLNKIKAGIPDENIYWKIMAYIGTFHIGPSGYVPVEVKDAWTSFRMWRKRKGHITYDEAQCKLLQLYRRYIKDAKGNIPEYGWTFLWLSYFEEGSRMYNAVRNLLESIVERKKRDINSIASEYNLSAGERKRLLYAAPVDGLVALADIYCRDIDWGNTGLLCLQEKVKHDMKIVTAFDIQTEDIFNRDTDSWLYTFKNIPDGVEAVIIDRIRNDIVGLIADRIRESGSDILSVNIKDKLNRVLDIICGMHFADTGERFIDNISIADLCKVLFDYARRIAGDKTPLEALHAQVNMDILRDNELPSFSLPAQWADITEGNKTLLVFTHRHRDTAGFLYWVQERLESNPGLTIKVIPQKSVWEANSNRHDIAAAVETEKKLTALAHFMGEGRFVVLDDCTQGLSWVKMPKEAFVKKELLEADSILCIGWENFVSFQGLKRGCYFTFDVDDLVKSRLTGYDPGERVFVKTSGGLPAISPGGYTLKEYLRAAGGKVYAKLLVYFGGDRKRLNRWIRMESSKRGKNMVSLMRLRGYSENPFGIFKEYALKDTDADAGAEALDVIINNYREFGIRKCEAGPVKIGDVKIDIGDDIGAECFYFPGSTTAVLLRGGEKMIIELQDDGCIRIGDKVYRITGDIDLRAAAGLLSIWAGNDAFVRFFGAEYIKKEQGMSVKKDAGLSMQDIPAEIMRRIPQTRPASSYSRAEAFFDTPYSCLPLALHYAVVLLSSPSVSRRVKGLEELRRIRDRGDEDIAEIIKGRGLSRVEDWLNEELPTADRDVFSLANFTKEQERIIRALAGGYLFRPPLVRMPGQGVSAAFHTAAALQVQGLGVNLVRGDYASGAGSVLLQNGKRDYIKEGDPLAGLSENLPEGQMIGAVRLKDEEGSSIIQIPENAGILNYIRLIHHMAHIISGKMREARGEEADIMREFIPAAEDILAIKYMGAVRDAAKDGFSDFKKKVRESADKDMLERCFRWAGLIYPAGRMFSDIKADIEGISGMAGFAGYIEKNRLGSFISVKELLNVMIDYLRQVVKGYMKDMEPYEQEMLERMLLADNTDKINSLLTMISFLSGSYVPKIDISGGAVSSGRLLMRPHLYAEEKKEDAERQIYGILQSGDPFTEKAANIVEMVSEENTGLMFTEQEKADMETKIMDILTGKWFGRMRSMILERLIRMEAMGEGMGRLKKDMDMMAGIMTHPSPEERRPLRGRTGDGRIGIMHSWMELKDYVKQNNIRRIFCDIDKTIMDAAGFITSTPWFVKMKQERGLEETVRVWRELEDDVLKRGMMHLMEGDIPAVLAGLKESGVEVVLYTARGPDDLERTQRILKYLGVEGFDIITSRSGTPEGKRDALAEYYERNGLFDTVHPNTLFIDDTYANLETVCIDERFRHINGLWYRAPYVKRYEVNPEEFLEAGDTALRAGNTAEALEWYYNAFYVQSMGDISGLIYSVISGYLSVDASLERIFRRFVDERMKGYKRSLEWEEEHMPRAEKDMHKERKKEAVWIEGAPDIADSEFWKGVKTIVVIGSHPHGDHIKGFVDYAKRSMKNLVSTVVPSPGGRKTGGAITHSLSNYWGRVGDETIVLFDLGWFPEGFIDPLIHTIHPEDREIVFVMDPATERTLDFSGKLKRIKAGKNIKLDILGYDMPPLKRPIEKGRLLQIQNFPAYHLAPEVGSSIYILKILDAETGKVIESIGYISELGDRFPEEMGKSLLDEISSLDRIIVDGTNLIAPQGEEPKPLKERPNKVHRYIRQVNSGRYLIAYLNTTSIRMGEEAALAAQKLDAGIPIVIIGGKAAIGQLKRSYGVERDKDYFEIDGKKVYLVHDIAGFHRRMLESGQIPELESVLAERTAELKGAGWTDGEIRDFTEEWKRGLRLDVEEYKGPEGKVREIERLLWDLRKTKAVVISSGQFRGDLSKMRYRNFKGFQVLDAVVDKKDVCILVEGRLHIEGAEGSILRVLLDRKKKEREIQSITGKKKIRASVDNQWRSGHITFRGLMGLLGRIAERAVEQGNIYSKRLYLPLPPAEWFGYISAAEKEKLRHKYSGRDIRDIACIINKWNNRSPVLREDIYFAVKVLDKIFKNPEFWSRCIGTIDTGDVRRRVSERLKMVLKEAELNGRADIRIFVASTSKFKDVLKKVKAVVQKGVVWKRRLMMDPAKLYELFRISGRFTGFELGVSYEHGKTVDLINRRYKTYSRDLADELNREYLKELYMKTVRGEIPPDLGVYHRVKNMGDYEAEFGELVKKADRRAKRKRRDPFPVWKKEMKKYTESQFLRIGMRCADELASYPELRKELSMFYDAVTVFVSAYLAGEDAANIRIIAGDDYAAGKALFGDRIKIAFLGKDKRLGREIIHTLEDIGIPAEEADIHSFLYARDIAGKSYKLRPDRENITSERKKRFRNDIDILRAKAGFSVYDGPGGLRDIELVRLFYADSLTAEENSVLDDTEKFLRRYKEEIGLSTGGDKVKAGRMFREIMQNIGYSDTPSEFKNMFFANVRRSYFILRRVMGRNKNLSFGKIDEEEDIHKGVFKKAEEEGRLFPSESGIGDKDIERAFAFIRDITKDVKELGDRRFVVIREKGGDPTLIYKEDPFVSLLSHSGKSTNTIYIGLNTVRFARMPVHRKGFINLLLHENRDIKRGYHMPLADEVKEGIISWEDIDTIYALWNDMITNGEFSRMRRFYRRRALEHRYSDYFLRKIPADIRIMNESALYEFSHGDVKGLPDYIGMNIGLFRGMYSPEAQVFLLRHCTDRIRYGRYKTIVNDAKYLLAVPEDERRKIFEDLRGCPLADFLEKLLEGYRRGGVLKKGAKHMIMEYIGLRFKAYTSPDGASIWYAVGGNPYAERTIVFIHGIVVNPRDWRSQIALFEDRFRIITIGLRGFGKSKGLGRKIPDIKNYTEDLEGILEKENIKDAVLVGHSMGGMVILNMDELYEDVPEQNRRIKGIALIASTAGNPFRSFLSRRISDINLSRIVRNIFIYSEYFDSLIWRDRLFKRAAGILALPLAKMLVMSKETTPYISGKIVRSVFKNDIDAVRYGFRAIMRHNVRDRLSRLRVPVLWVIGEKDRIVLPEAQEMDASYVKQCTVLRVPDARHYPHLGFPRRVNKAIYRLADNGTFRFAQLLSKRINRLFGADISLDDLESDMDSIKLRIIPRLGGISEEDMRIIDGVSDVVKQIGAETGVEDDMMVKSVMIISGRIISAKRAVPLPVPFPVHVGDIHNSITNSA